MKSFLFMLKLVLSLFLVSNIVACSNITRRNDNFSSTEKQVVSNEDNKDAEFKEEPELKKTKLGVILGPGFLKAYAHLGVLKELEKKNIDISHISGVGWGAFVAGGFAIKARSSNLEWQMFKIDESVLPSKGIFGSKMKVKDPKALDPLLSKIFSRTRIENSEIKFNCMTTNLRSFSTRLTSQGRYTDELKRCIAGNSYYSEYRNWIWEPLSIEALIDEQRKAGVEKILLVDVISRSDLEQSSGNFHTLMDYYVWGKSDRMMSNQANKVDYYLQVNTSGLKMNDRSKLREFVRRGSKSAKPLMERISQEIMGR